jgi:hypothetical protein
VISLLIEEGVAEAPWRVRGWYATGGAHKPKAKKPGWRPGFSWVAQTSLFDVCDSRSANGGRIAACPGNNITTA